MAWRALGEVGWSQRFWCMLQHCKQVTQHLQIPAVKSFFFTTSSSYCNFFFFFFLLYIVSYIAWIWILNYLVIWKQRLLESWLPRYSYFLSLRPSPCKDWLPFIGEESKGSSSSCPTVGLGSFRLLDSHSCALVIPLLLWHWQFATV